MRVEGTPEAAAVVEQVRAIRLGELTITLGNGCCESSAPFLFDGHWPGPDQVQVGEVSGVPVYAPEFMRKLYPGDDLLIVDVGPDGHGDSFSVETELGFRFILLVA